MPSGFGRRVYLDCAAGIAGDMLLAALLDLGASLAYVREGLERLGLAEAWTLEGQEVSRAGIRARRAVVTISGRPADAIFEETAAGGEGPPDAPQHRHDHEEQAHAPHRPYREIRRLLEGAELPARAKERALAVFAELAKAEGAVHGVSADEVHFHEVGSTDAIIDVVGCCLALEELGVDRLEASPLHLGSGFVTAAHGRLPVPAPATLRLLEGMAAYQTDIEGELTTPTGAALVRALCGRVGPLGLVRIDRVGHGAGSKDRIVPNMVRALLLRPEPQAETDRDEVVELACNLDDMNPQLFAGVFDALFENGALDVWVEPVVMKKGRPGHVLKAMAPPENAEALSSVLLRETTTLGVRVHTAARVMLGREWIAVGVAGDEVRVKIGRRGTDVWNVAPEYDDCARVAAALGRPLKLIMDEAKAAAWTQLSAGRSPAARVEASDGS